MAKETNAYLDTALKAAGYSPCGSDTYTHNDCKPIYTDGDQWKEKGGYWKPFFKGQSFRKKS